MINISIGYGDTTGGKIVVSGSMNMEFAFSFEEHASHEHDDNGYHIDFIWEPGEVNQAVVGLPFVDETSHVFFDCACGREVCCMLAFADENDEYSTLGFAESTVNGELSREYSR